MSLSKTNFKNYFLVYAVIVLTLIETISGTYLKNENANLSKISFIYFGTGVLISFLVLIQIKIQNQNSKNISGNYFVKTFSKIFFEKNIEKIFSKNIFKKYFTQRNFLFLFFTIAFVHYTPIANKYFHEVPIDYHNADMIPIMKVQAHRFLVGEKVYGPAWEIWGGIKPIYLTFMWLPLTISDYFNFDARWMILGWLVLGIYFCLSIARYSKIKLATFLAAGGLFLVINFMMTHDKPTIVFAEEGIVIGYYLFLGFALSKKNPLLISLAIVFCVLSSYVLIFWLPVFFLYWFLFQSKKQTRYIFGVSSILILVTFLLPYATSDFNFFSNLPEEYIKMAQNIWKSNPSFTWETLGFAKFFSIDSIPRLHSILLISSFSAPLIYFLIFFSFRKKNWINADMFSIGALKLTMVVFYNFLEIPYDYLFYTSTFFTYCVVFNYLREEVPIPENEKPSRKNKFRNFYTKNILPALNNSVVPIKNLQKIITSRPYLFLLFIPILSIFLHWRIFTTDLIGIHVWRQSQTMINIQNFYRHDFNIFNPRNNYADGTITRFEFPIMQWLIAGLHKIFGEAIIITRISMFCIGLWGIFGMNFMMNNIFKNTFAGIIGAWIFTFMPVFYYYTMNPLPDVYALCSTIWAIGFFFRFYNNRQFKNIYFSAFFLSLATLAKLPYIIFGAIVGAYFLTGLFKNKGKQFFLSLKIPAAYFIFLLPALVWYKFVIPTWGDNGVLKGFFDNQISIQKTFEIFNYHYTTMFPDLLLNFACVPFFLAGLYFMFKNKILKTEKGLILASAGVMVLVYFIFEFNMIDIIHDYYMLPFLPVLVVLVVYGLKKLSAINTFTKLLSVVLLAILPLTAFKSVDMFWSDEKTYFNPDILDNRETLRKLIPNDEKCIFLNDNSNFIFSYMVDKQGYTFGEDRLPINYIEDFIKNKNVHYLYSDSRKVDTIPEFKSLVDTVIYNRGSVKVFKLKKL